LIEVWSTGTVCDEVSLRWQLIGDKKVRPY
jgi:hypothetical protein